MVAGARGNKLQRLPKQDQRLHSSVRKSNCEYEPIVLLSGFGSGARDYVLLCFEGGERLRRLPSDEYLSDNSGIRSWDTLRHLQRNRNGNQWSYKSQRYPYASCAVRINVINTPAHNLYHGKQSVSGCGHSLTSGREIIRVNQSNEFARRNRPAAAHVS